MFFVNDYGRGAHPKIMDALVKTNLSPEFGYGTDRYTENAATYIKRYFNLADDSTVYFLSGGTQVNLVTISSVLKSYEGVIAAKTGHIATHEAGAIEFTRHKVLTLPEHEGKINASQVESYLQQFYDDANHSHMVYPGMVYISHPTEYGTLYTKSEMQALSNVCRQYHIPLFVDGARLAYAFGAQSDLSPSELAEFADIFYIGGTKAGTLIGEALVFANQDYAPKNFPTIIKQHGALLAKGRLIGVQFETLFKEGLFTEIGQHAVKLAMILKHALIDKGYELYIDSPTNQQFIIVTNAQLETLSQSVQYSFWEQYSQDKTVIRLVTDWSTTQEDIDALIAIL